MQCDKCRVAQHCQKQGSSPLYNNTTMLLCRIVGGYGKEPVPLAILSESSKKLVEEHGPCLTIAEIPIRDEASGDVYFETIKIFHEPILHEREKTNFHLDMLYPRSHN
jgi:hypothetical protein